LKFSQDFGKTIVDERYKSIIPQFYNYTELNTTNTYENTLSVTQMLWKSTTSIGIGILNQVLSWGNDGGFHFFVKCWYNPAGNINGQYKNNVFPPTV
jgi:hypothetical protein